MPTVRTVIVAPSDPGGYDAHYTSLSAALAGESKDLVTLDRQLNFEVQSGLSSSSSTVVVSGWTTDSSRYVEIRAASGHEANGALSGGAEIVGTGALTFEVLSCEHIKIKDLRFENTGTGANETAIINSTESLEIERCVFVCNSIFRNALEILSSGSDTAVLKNCRFVGGDRGINFISFGSVSLEALNCTITDADDEGLYCQINSGSPLVTIKNTVSIGAATDFVVAGATLTASNNASGDTTAPGTSAQTSITTAAFTYYANDDLTPASGGSLAGTGTDLSGTFTDDITGATRSTWDIGAFAAVGGGGATVEAAGVTQSQIIGEPALTQSHVLSPASISQSQSISQPVITQAYAIAPAALEQAQTIAQPILTQAHIIAPAGLLQSQLIDAASLSQAGSISPAQVSQAQAIGTATITQAHQLAVDSIGQAQSIDQALITVAGVLAVEGVTQAQTLGALELVQAHVLAPNGITQGQALDATTLNAAGLQIDPDDVSQSQALDPAALTQYHVIAVDSLTQQQIIDVANFGGLVLGELEGKIVVYAALSGTVYAIPALSGTIQ